MEERLKKQLDFCLEIDKEKKHIPSDIAFRTRTERK